MDWIYAAGGVLYVAMLSFILWKPIKERGFWDILRFYKPERGGYVDLDRQWVAQKNIWKQWGWYGVAVFIVLSLPIVIPCVFLWGRFIEPLLKKILPVKQKAAPGSIMDSLMASPRGPVVDLDKLGAELLDKLPRCTARVVIAGDEHFTGDVVADSRRLFSWARRHGVIYSIDEKQAAREVLPAWLKGADRSNITPSHVTAPFRAILRDYAETFVTKKIAKVFCNECRAFISDVTVDRINPRNDGVFDWHTVMWHCPAGHLLHREDLGYRVFHRRESR